MSEQSKFANQPLMYIHQSTQSKPNAPMQHFYTTPKKSVKSETPSLEVEKKTIKPAIKKRPSISSYIGSTVADKEINPIEATRPEEVGETNASIPKEKKEINDIGTKKKFKDMTIEEKINYFLNSSSHLPRMRCEVITSERKYRGVILQYQENEIQMRVGRRMITLKVEDINEIQLIGF